MMFASLRSRLWLSYALLIIVALTVVGGVLLGYLITNPVIYRQATNRINQVEKTLLDRQGEWSSLSAREIQTWFNRIKQSAIDQDLSVRILVFDPRHNLIADSDSGISSTLLLPHLPRIRSTGVVRDETGSAWLYSVSQLRNGNWLVVTAPRPPVPLRAILSDEFFTPIIRAGIVALLLSLVLALLVARWIADPLQQLVRASRQMPSDELPPLPGRGPQEIRELVRAFQEMFGRVQASQKSQRDFVANVSHEMKTPLTSIQGFSQAILDGTANTSEAQQQAAEIIYNEAGRMHRMVVDLLDLAKLDSGTANLNFAPLNIVGLLQTIVEKFGLHAKTADVTLRLDADALTENSNTPLAIAGDGDRLAQVLTNLVDNAIRHTPAGGEVILRASAAPDWVTIQVQDSGEGISPAALPHIFDRFYRADPARKGGAHGAGLGLAIAHEIVLAHQGSLTAASTPGQGSTFTMKLPIARPDASTVASRRTPLPHRKESK